jgi:hypothetical protein
MDTRGALDSVTPLTGTDPEASTGASETDGSGDPRDLHGELERQQISQARRGQGVFKYNVRLIESGCRLTGVSVPRHLRASHIKPWKDSDDFEKLDGANGLLMSPHVDHLFDRGLISFRDDGEVLRSSTLETEVMRRWSLDKVNSAGPFSVEQSRYLEYHRDLILVP